MNNDLDQLHSALVDSYEMARNALDRMKDSRRALKDAQIAPSAVKYAASAFEDVIATADQLAQFIQDSGALDESAGRSSNKMLDALIFEKAKLDPVGKEDGDVDNDGDVDSSDEYLKKRREAISKNMD